MVLCCQNEYRCCKVELRHNNSVIPDDVQLRECAAVLLMKLLDDQVPALMEGTQLLKALNVLMLKILDNCNRYWCGNLVL